MTSKSVSLFLWAWLFIIPLTYNFWGLDPALYSKFLLLDWSLLLGGIVVYRSSKQPILIKKSVAVFIGIYSIYFLISLPSLVLFGINKSDGWFIWLHLSIIPVFVLLLTAFDQLASIRNVEAAKIISYLAVASMLAGLIQYILEVANHGWAFSSSDMMKATFAHKNIFAEILLLTFPFSSYLGVWMKKKVHFAIAFATVVVLIMLLSRAVWAGFLTGITVCGTCYLISSGDKKFKSYRLLFLLSAAIFAFFLIGWLMVHVGLGSKLAYFYRHRNTLNERRRLWNTTWQIIQIHPLLGSGPGSWKVLNMRYGIVGLRNYSTFFQQPHNDALWIWSEQGLLGLLCVSGAWLYLLFMLLRKVYFNPPDAFLYCLLFALTGYGVYSNFGFPRERAEHSIILAFVAFFALKNSDGHSTRNLKMPKYIWLFNTIILAIAAWWAGNKLVSEIELRQYFEARSQNDTAGELLALDKINQDYYLLDGTATPINWYQGMAHFTRKELAEALIYFEKAIEANPYHAYSLANTGACLSLKGENEEASKYFRLALNYSPGFPEAALNLSAIKYNAKQIDSAAYYLGMANDSLSNPRYKQFLTVVMQASIQPLLDSETVKGNEILVGKYKRILASESWQMHICKDAFTYHRTIPEQVKRDVVWSIRYDDKNPTLADEINKYFQLGLQAGDR